jgi:hypothetical protein
MASRVGLHVRIVRPDGSRTYAASVYAANRRLRGGYAIVSGNPEQHPEAGCYLRYLVEGEARLAERWPEPSGHPERPGRPGAPDQGTPSASPAWSSLQPRPRHPHTLFPPVAAESERVSWKAAVREYLLEIAEVGGPPPYATLY